MKKEAPRIYLFAIVFLFGLFLNTHSAFAAAPALTSTVLQNTTATTVDFYITGSNFNSFSHGYTGTQIMSADSTDLNNITYNGTLHPTSATIVENGVIKHLTATFNVSDVTSGKLGGSITIAAGTIRNSTTQNGLFTVVDGSITDSASPYLVQTSAPTTSDYTPDYVFTSTEAGNITYGGDCTSATGTATVGTNTITFDTLAGGTHNNCTIVVTDSSTNASSTLNVPSFVLGSPPLLVSAKITGANEVTVTYSVGVSNNSSGNYTNFGGVLSGRTITGQADNSDGSDHIVFTFDGDPMTDTDSGTLDISSTVTNVGGDHFTGASSVPVTWGGSSPVMNSAVWKDVDNSGTFSNTDTLTVTFSKAMDTSTIGGLNVDSRLGLSNGHTFGVTNDSMVVWSVGDTVLTITFGSGVNVSENDTLNPSPYMTSALGSSDKTISNSTLVSNTWYAEYWNTGYGSSPSFDFSQGNPVFIENVNGTDLSINWGTGSPTQAINQDGFVGRFTKTVNMALAGQLAFAVSSDDGIRVYVDGVRIVNGWQDTYSTTVNTDDLSSGNHTIVVEYYENGGYASLSVVYAYQSTLTDVYVDSTYTSEGANDGHTWGVDAFDNVASGIAGVGTGGTVHVAGGTYVDSNTLTISRAINIIGPGIESGTPAIVINNDNCNYVFSIEASYSTISGLFIRETTGDNETYCMGKPVIRVAGDGGNATHTTITANDISGGKRGIQLRGNSDTSTISNNIVHDNTDGVSLTSSKHNTITGNTIYNNSESGVHFWWGDGFDGNSSDNTVSSNIIHDNGFDGILIEANDSDNIFSGNTIYANYKHGIAIKSNSQSPGHENIIRGNTIYDNGLYADSGPYGPSGIEVMTSYTQVLNNIVTHNRRNGIQVGGDGSTDYVIVSGNTIGTATIGETSYEGNTERGIYVLSGSGHQIHNNIISGNIDYGVLNNSGFEVDAASNWWGNASGPLEVDTNSGGTGDQVSTNIIYNPYLSSEVLTSHFYVDSTYTSEGENDGHIWGVDAYADISSALINITSAGTITVAGGTYTSGGIIAINIPVIINGPGKDNENPAIIINNSCGYVFSVQASDTTLSGMIIKQQNGDEICTSGPAVRVASNSSGDDGPHTSISNVTITDNEIVGGGRSIVLRGDSGSNIVTNNNMHNSGDGIFIASSKHNTVSGNYIHDTDGDGINISDGGCDYYFCDGNPDNNTILENIIYNNDSNGVFEDRGKDNTFSSNIVHDNYRNGITIHINSTIAEGHGNIIDGNTVYNNGLISNTGGPGPAGIDAGADYTQVTNNIVAYNKWTGVKIGGGDFDSDNVTITGNTIGSAIINDIVYNGNIGYGIYVYRGTGHAIHLNNISRNAYGAYNDTGIDVDATENWWGNASGPLEVDTNPSGTGDQVSANVLYGDYVSTAYGSSTTAPTLTTSTTTNITQTSATLNGSVSSTGGANSTVHGFNYGTTGFYDTNTTITADFGADSFSSNITGLSCGTTYYFRSYATSTAGTGTSSGSSFTTQSCPHGGGFVFISPPKITPPTLNIQNQITSGINANPLTSLTNPLSFGNSNLTVKALQEFLNANGFVISSSGSGSPGKETNYLGLKTVAAIKKFQKANHLQQTGALGPLTRALIKKMLMGK